MSDLRSSDWRRARAGTFRDPYLDARHKPSELLDYFEDEAKLMRLKVAKKSTFPGVRWQSLSTTFYGQIRLGTKYDAKSTFWKCVTFGHELVHARQWRHYGRSEFRRRYLFSPRFRLAVEAQAYAESVRIIIALGGSSDVVEGFIDHVVQSIVSTYALGFPLKPSRVRRLFDVVLHEAAVQAYAKRRPVPVKGIVALGTQ